MPLSDVRHTLPVHPVPLRIPNGADSWRLRVTGLVARPGQFTLQELDDLPRVDLTDDFVCEEGWRVPDLRWAGVPLRALLDRVAVRPEARFVRIGSGDFFVTLPLSMVDARLPILADTLAGRPLTREHGAPLRLVAPGQACFASVKWVDRIDLLAENTEPDSAPAIARVRLRGESFE